MSPAWKIFFSFFISLLAVAISHPLMTNMIDEQQQSDMIDLSSLGVMLFSEPDEAVGRAVQDWSPDDSQNPEELGTYLEGDMLIPGVEGRNGLVSASSRWPEGKVPFVISSSIGYSDESLIRRAMDEYHRNTCIRFVERTNERDYISIENSNTGCWSSVGKVGKRQSINLQTPGCTSKVGTPIHELMHALGFLHEQNRYNRDSYVRVITSNIKPDTLPNFEKASASETIDYGVQYDTASVMHYSSTAFSRNGQKTIEALRGNSYNMGQRDGFAPSDLAKLNKMYNCGDSPSQGIGSYYPRPTYEKPNRPGPIAGTSGGSPAGSGNGGGFTNPIAQFVSGLGNIFSALGGKHDEADESEGFNNQIDD